MTGEPASESLRDLRISVKTLGDLLLAASDRYPDRDAVVFPESRVRYRELAGRALRRARGLRAVGVRPGDKVGLLLPDSPDLAVTLFGIALAGGTVVPIDTRTLPGELGHVVANADLVTLVATDRSADPETGEDLPAGQDGELLVRGYSLFEGYYKDPDGTARALDAGGWYHTGEIASLDADGALLFQGRRRD